MIKYYCLFKLLLFYVSWKHTEHFQHKCIKMEASRVDSDLPHKMAHLELMDIGESSTKVSSPESTLRTLRKRKSFAPETSKPSNRRVSMKPRKHTLADNANPKQIEALYLNKKVKTLSQTLETIYEEPKINTTNSDTLITGRKVKRLLTFQIGNHYSKEKIKKRRAKIKKLLGNKTFLNRKKIPMQVFLKTIECLELDEVDGESEKTLDSVSI